MQLEIRDALGEVLPDGEEGEIHLRGPMVMPGYWNRPDATDAVIGPGRWLHTGDIGRMEGGRLYLASRRRDLIIRGGENIYPVEIENRPRGASRRGRGRGRAASTTRSSARRCARSSCRRRARRSTPDELAEFCADELAYFKVPAHWDIRTEPLPRNASGKVVKQVLLDGAPLQFVEDDA